MLKQFKENHPFINAFAEGVVLTVTGTLGAATLLMAISSMTDDKE